jgi:superfamily I DNA and/or RNA helicase
MESQDHVDDEVCDKGEIRNVPKHVIKDFIEVYRDHPSLWQLKNKEMYGNKLNSVALVHERTILTE